MSQGSICEDALWIFRQALAECSIERAFERKVKVSGSAGSGAGAIAFESDLLNIAGVRHLRIVSIGKAAGQLVKAFLSGVPVSPSCDLKGVVIARDAPGNLPRGIAYFAGGHPLPNQASFDGARAALQMLHEATKLKDALCVYLISGGASAMMELPLDDSISLEDTIALNRVLVHSGASIEEINCVRKHLSAVKGGRLALAAGETPAVSILVSDVPPQALDSLASGPTLPDTSTVEQCRAIVDRYRLAEQLPDPVRRLIASADLKETPKPGDIQPRIWKLLDSGDLADAARAKAAELGYGVVIDNSCDDWNYTDAARYLLERLRELRGAHSRLCLISVGEITVRVPSEFSGAGEKSPRAGGRNQHFALHAATLLDSFDAEAAVLSAGSDGIDGNSAAAGAVVDKDSLKESGLVDQAGEALRRFDSGTFLEQIGASIVTGPTGNNLRDLRVLLARVPGNR